MSRCLVIGDTHAPVTHPMYLKFCQDLRDHNKCDVVVHIGDAIDHHAISFHAHHPNCPGPKDEFELAHKCLRPWVNAFPKAKVCIGNHCARVIRLAESVNIPSKFIREYADVWDTPGWDWQDAHTVDEVYYTHGTGQGGINPAFTLMQKLLCSVVIGHVHTAGGIAWRANPQRRIFGLNTGCGVDDRAAAFAYAKFNSIRSILSSAVVIDGVPQHIIMPCGPGERYSRAKFRKGGK